MKSETDTTLDNLRDTANKKRIIEYNARLAGELRCSGFMVNTGLHGQIFITPINKGNVFTKSFDTMQEAHTYYFTNTYFTNQK